MAFNQPTSSLERGPFRALRSRASSATLFIAQRSFGNIDGTSDAADMIIAQGLLVQDSPQVPTRKSSFGYTTHPQLQSLLDGNTGTLSTGHRRRDRRSAYNASSNTWTSSSGDASESDENENREMFVQEYNRMAKKYGIELIVPDKLGPVNAEEVPAPTKHGSWIKRKLLRRTSSSLTMKSKPEKQFRHKRSISDLSLRMRAKRDTLKDKGLEDLVRLCGSSALYLPAEYAACTLAVPTCFRATAQYLVQHASTCRGIFRIPGSHTTVNALYNHYASQDEDGEMISGTVRCPTLPEHIKYDVHDVASAFKKFLAGLPGGILGRVWLFDAFASIHCQLDADPEQTKTKQSKVRARMIALTIASTVPRSQREFICAVMGLLSMVGRAAETAPREDEHGRPLPTSGLMGYGPLGIIFGPLLIGELLECHDSCPGRTLTLNPPKPPKHFRGKHKKTKSADDTTAFQEGVDKIRIANCIAEMLITHWREVVRHMKNLGALKSTREHCNLTVIEKPFLRPSASEYFTLRSPPDWEPEMVSIRQVGRSISPTPSPRIPQKDPVSSSCDQSSFLQGGNLSVKRQRSRPRPMSSQILSGARSMSILSPTKEETNANEQCGGFSSDAAFNSDRRSPIIKLSHSTQTLHTAESEIWGKTGKGEVRVRKLEAPKLTSAEEILQKSEVMLKPTTKLVTEIPEHIMMELKQTVGDPTPKECMVLQTHPDLTLCIEDAVGQDKPVERETAGKENSTLFSPTKKEGQATGKEKRIRLVSSPTGSLEIFLNESRFLTHASTELVSSRVSQLAAGKPSATPSLGLTEILHTQTATIDKQRRMTGLGAGSSQTRGSYTKDPLAKVSQEEDMASLASLAKVIQFQEQNRECNYPPKPELGHRANTTASVNSSPERKSSLNDDCLGLGARNYSRDTGGEKIYEKESPSITTIMITRRPTDKQPITPRRPVTDPVLSGRGRNGSVKALAAKFNSGTTIGGYSPSPTKPSGLHTSNCSRCESAVISSYTTNQNIGPRSSTSCKSDRSLQSLRKPLPASRYAASLLTTPLPKDIMESPLYPKPLSISRHRTNESRPPRWPEMTPLAQLNSKQDELALSTSPTRLYGQSGNSGSFKLSRQLSKGRQLRRLDEPLIDSYADFTRPPSTPVSNHIDRSQSPFGCFGRASRESRASTTSEMPNTSIGGYDGKSRGTSVLYTQIQSLQKQLRIKADEADQMRRQLMTKESLHDLGTLSEQLRQAKRELGIWRSRAETAEKRLEILSQLLSKQSVTEHTKDQFLATESFVQHPENNSIKGGEGGELLMDRTRTLHGVDGARSDDGSQMSDGTVRHMSPDRLIPLDGDINLSEIPSVELLIKRLQEPYELEQETF